mmetsp:Transcript_31571/g.91810  ORF Transcript_31571/g.91810 Transcript_31571/m.91810 type:complete len:219 (+) Transcript_31571:652-1308(+)
MQATAFRGKEPPAVSPESMTASVPSRTAFATSETSARVGRGFPVMDSSICVAVITGLPTMLQREIIIFWAMKTWWGGISMPRSPRATMMPSLASRMSSKFSRPSWFSILLMILIPLPSSPRISRMYSTSALDCTKDAATKSTPWGMPNSRMSAISFGWRTGRSTLTPGRFMFLRSPILALFSTRTSTKPLPHSSTVATTEPSAMRIVFPGTTLSGNFS